MCVAKHVYNLHKKPYYKVSPEGEEKKALGTAWHAIWEDLLKDSVIQASKPRYPYWLKQIIAEKEKEKGKHINEVYVSLPGFGISGYIDLVIKKSKKLIIGDFKTTNILPDKWLAEQVLLPTDKQKTQLYIYAVSVDLLNLYDKRVSGLVIPFYNNYCYGYKELKLPDPRYEWYSDIDPVLYQKTLDLLAEGRNQLFRYTNNYTEVCNYIHCGEHNG
jgi:hypothetical protein